MSESEAAGRLTRMPGIVDAAATMPVQSVGVSKLFAKGLSTGDFDMVELRIAKNPIKQSIRKMLIPASFDSVPMCPPTWNLVLKLLDGFKFYNRLLPDEHTNNAMNRACIRRFFGSDVG